MNWVAETRPPALFIDLSRVGQKVRMVVRSPDSENSGSQVEVPGGPQD